MTGIEVTSFVVDVVAPPPLSAIDVTVGDPAAIIIVDIPGSGGDDEVIGGKITIGPTAPASLRQRCLDRYVMNDFDFGQAFNVEVGSVTRGHHR